MGKYDKLESHLIKLAQKGHKKWATSCIEIEKLLGWPLCDSAKKHSAFWHWQNTDEYGVRAALRHSRWKIDAHSSKSLSLKFIYLG